MIIDVSEIVSLLPLSQNITTSATTVSNLTTFSIVIWSTVIPMCFCMFLLMIIMYTLRNKHPINKTHAMMNIVRGFFVCNVLCYLAIIHTSSGTANVLVEVVLKTIIVFTLPAFHASDIFFLIKIVFKTKYIYTKRKMVKIFGKFLNEERIKEISRVMASSRSRRWESISFTKNYTDDVINNKKTSKGSDSASSSSSNSNTVTSNATNNKKSTLERINTTCNSANNTNSRNNTGNKNHKNNRKGSPISNITSPRVKRSAVESLSFKFLKKFLTEKSIFIELVTIQLILTTMWIIGLVTFGFNSSILTERFNKLHAYESSFITACEIFFTCAKLTLLCFIVKIKFIKLKRITICISSIILVLLSITLCSFDVLAYFGYFKFEISLTFTVVPLFACVEVFVTTMQLIVKVFLKKRITHNDVITAFTIIDNDQYYKSLFKYATSQYNIEQISFIKYARQIKKKTGVSKKTSTRRLYETYLIRGISPLELNMTPKYTGYIGEITNYLNGTDTFPTNALDNLIMMTMYDSSDLFFNFYMSSEYKSIIETDSIKIKIN